MKTYDVGVIGCGRIASLLEQETWRGNPNTHAEEVFPPIPENETINTFGSGRCVLPASVQDLVDSLDRGAETASTDRDGRAALEMVLAFHESERLGNARVDFPLANRDLRVSVRPAEFISSARPEA